jgi:hypothetical protein
MKRPDQLYKYKPELERRVIENFDKNNPATPPLFASVLQPTKASVLQPTKAEPEQPKKAVVTHKEFEQTPPDDPWDVKTSVKDDLRELEDILGKTKLTDEPSASSMETAKAYLPDESQEKIFFFAKGIDRATKLGLTDLDALRAFYMWNGEMTAMVAYLEAFRNLRDLGFDQEIIDAALIRHNNDQDSALSYIMEHQQK